MKRTPCAILLGTSLLCGCGDNTANQAALNSTPPKPVYRGPTTAESQEVVATVRGEPITMQQLMEPLIESHGLTLLANIVQLDLAKQAAAKAHITVTQKDFDDECNFTLDKLFKDYDDKKLLETIDRAERAKNAELAASLRDQLRLEREDYLTQFLTNQHLDRVDFDLVLKMKTYLRKIAEPQVAPRITDEALQKVFGQLYGERVEVKWILLPNMDQVTIARQRLAQGVTFEQVAMDMSTDRRTAPLGGALEPFSRATEAVPRTFRDTAFSLRDGQISDDVAIGSSFAMIKRVKLDPPQLVKFEDVRGYCFQMLHDRLMDVAMTDLERQLAMEARTQIDIVEPILARQWQEKLNRDEKASERAAHEMDKDQTRKDVRRLAPDAPQGADTHTPEAVPAGNAPPKAVNPATGERPPATQPG